MTDADTTSRTRAVHPARGPSRARGLARSGAVADRCDPADDRGVGEVLVALVAVVVLGCSVVVGCLAVGVATRHRAELAADLAALGAARELSGATGGAALARACARARALASDNGGTLVACSASGEVVVVTVRVRPPGWLGRLGSSAAEARAGPAGPPGVRAFPRMGQRAVAIPLRHRGISPMSGYRSETLRVTWGAQPSLDSATRAAAPQHAAA